MQRIDNRYKIETKPLANQEAIVQGEHYRFTVLTSKLIRMEYQEDNLFEDRATKSVINRDFITPKFRVVDQPDKLEIYTEFLHLEYNKKPFSSNGLQISIRGNLTAYNNTWHYKDVIHDLGGTTRTLDLIDGSVPLEHGLLSQKGFTVLDDSKSILISE
ncbi:MAG: alpha-xylosidase, partial [Mobilitalea sp.]